MTRTVNLKTTLATGGRFTLAHPLATPGVQRSGAHVYRVVAVPDDVPASVVILAAEYSILLDPVKHRWTYDFGDLGSGRIVR